MGQNPSSESNDSPTRRAMPSVLWIPKIHYPAHKVQPLVPILMQMNPIDAFPSCFFKSNFNIIFPLTLRCSD